MEKKGTEVLLEALAQIAPKLHWRFVHVGSVPLRQRLERRARSLGIAARVTWKGALTQREILAEYQGADLFALASRIARDGDIILLAGKGHETGQVIGAGKSQRVLPFDDALVARECAA